MPNQNIEEMTNYKKIQKIIHDEIERWSHIKPNSITNNIMKQLGDGNLIFKQPIAEGETVYQKVLVKDADEKEITPDWIYVKQFDFWLKPTTLPLSVKMPSDEVMADKLSRFIDNMGSDSAGINSAIESFIKWLRSQITLSKGEQTPDIWKGENVLRQIMDCFNDGRNIPHTMKQRTDALIILKDYINKSKGVLDAGKVEEYAQDRLSLIDNCISCIVADYGKSDKEIIFKELKRIRNTISLSKEKLTSLIGGK